MYSSGVNEPEAERYGVANDLSAMLFGSEIKKRKRNSSLGEFKYFL